MATSVQNRPYQELTPLPIPRPKCPRLLEVLKKVAYLAAITLFGAAFGAAMSVTFLPVNPILGTAIATLAALVAGAFFIRILSFPSPLKNYRIQTLEQIKSTLSNPRALHAIQNLEGFFSAPFIRFPHMNTNHQLHNEITVICDAIDPSRDDVKKVWKQFLDHIHGRKIQTPDGGRVKLNFQREMYRLYGDKIEPELAQLNLRDPLSDRALDQIVHLQEVSLGKGHTFSKVELKAAENARCLISREKGKSRVLAFIFAQEEENVVTIKALARNPGVCRLGLGNALLTSLLRSYPKETKIQLQVRASNQAAIRLYEFWKFEKKEELPGFYKSGPAEDGHLMELNRAAFDELIAELEASNA